MPMPMPNQQRWSAGKHIIHAAKVILRAFLFGYKTFCPRTDIAEQLSFKVKTVYVQRGDSSRPVDSSDDVTEQS